MSDATVRAGFDTWAGSAKPDLEHPREKVMRLQSSLAYGYLWMKNPAPRGAVITRATLTLRARGASSGSRTFSVNRVAESWKEGRVNWRNKPPVSGSAVTKAFAALKDGDEIEVDVTSIVQAWASGARNFGFRLAQSSGTAIAIGSLNSGYKPRLSVEWSDAPAEPVDLRPSEASTSKEKPHLTFSFSDVSGNTSLGAVQVLVSTSETMTSPWDSGRVPAEESGLDLSRTDLATAFPALALAETRYWRARVQDGGGLWSPWSEVASMTRTAKPVVAFANLSGGVLYDPTPLILWTVTGGTQVKWRLFVYTRGGAVKFDSKERTGTATSFTIPEAAKLQEGTTYRLELRVWDEVARQATPGDHVYTSVEADFSIGSDTAVAPVTNLKAVAEDVSPWVVLTWDRSTTPDDFVLVRDGKVIRKIDPAEAFVSGTSYRFRYFGARPNREHAYQVKAVTAGANGGRQSASNPTVRLTTSPAGLWLVDTERGIDVTLWGNDEGSWNMADDAAVFTPVGSSEVVRIVNGLRGLDGSLSGLLMEGFGKTFDQMEAQIYEIKSRPTASVRIVAGDENFEALIGNVRVSPKPESRQGRIVKGVSLDFWQVGDLPYALSG